MTPYEEEKLNSLNAKAPYCGCGCGERLSVSPAWLKKRLATPTWPKYKAGHNQTKLDPSLIFTEEEESVVIGSVLGDACLSYAHSTARYPRYSENHSAKQEEYVRWKAEVLGRFSPSVSIRDNPGYGEKWCRLAFATHPEWSRIYSIMYSDGVKRITTESLNRLGPLGLAIWYQDDGSVNVKGRHSFLSTNGFNEGCVETARDWFNSRGMDCRMQRDKRNGYFLVFSVGGTEHMFSIITPYVHPTLAYKLLRRELVGMASGERHKSAKLTEKEVQDIRGSCDSLIDLSTRYGMNLSHISEIRNNKVWRHLPWPK